MTPRLQARLGSGRLLLLLGLLAPAVATRSAVTAPEVGRPLPPWQRGMLDIHCINTGTGDATFFILPDGTTLLLDAGAVDRSQERPANYDAPPRPDASLRPGQWIARYIRHFHPDGPDGALEYAALTHFHGDHMGTLTAASPPAASGAYRLTGITDVGDTIRIRRMLDRDWPRYDFPAPSGGEMMRNYRAFLQWQRENRGLQAERFEPGRADQLVLVRDRAAFPSFEIRNIAANARVWTGAGTTARDRYPAGQVPVENNCSLAFRLTYGAFRYFNGGDMAGFLPAGTPMWRDMESAVAWVTGPVDVHDLNHHGTPDGANAFFLSVLQPRVHILSTYAASQPGPDLLRRLLSDQLYPGPRDVFMTNGTWPGRREHMVKLYGEADTAWLLERFREFGSAQGHIIVRVEPGGGSYRVIVTDEAGDPGRVLSVHGPYAARGAPEQKQR